ncbi:MAG: creatininase family protein [Caldilineae bacterium]|nr:MAG: creatininase family protein [Caldilineae bacterium]
MSSILLAELTRDAIARLAPEATVVLPTASIEQHGPHLAVATDTILCTAVARRAAEQAAGQIPVLVAPTFCYGNSHHHFPFPGVLSLSSQVYAAAVTDVLEGLVKSGFRRLVLLNGHGGNTDLNRVIALDMANRLGHPVQMAAAAYWDVARPRLAEAGLIPDAHIPGHAGRFETALMLAVRPDLVDREGLARAEDVSAQGRGPMFPLTGATVQVHGAWGAGPGYTDAPASATEEEGAALLAIIQEAVAAMLVTFHNLNK